MPVSPPAGSTTSPFFARIEPAPNGDAVQLTAVERIGQSKRLRGLRAGAWPGPLEAPVESNKDDNGDKSCCAAKDEGRNGRDMIP